MGERIMLGLGIVAIGASLAIVLWLVAQMLR
jgi:hypothetical protein